VQLVMSMADFTQSVPDALAHKPPDFGRRLENEGKRVVARQHADTAIQTSTQILGGGKHQNSRCSVKMLSCQRYSYSYSYSAE